VFYIAMCKSCEKDIESAAVSQMNTSFSLNNLVSDRGSITKVKNGYASSRVVKEIRKLVHETKAKGPYALLIKCLKEKHEKIYLIRSKNGRGRREFATQEIKSRLIQSFEELNCSGISISAPDDKFLDPHKYNEMVDGFTDILSSDSPVCASSEDRSFHCGHNIPEGMSLACKCHAVVNCIPYMNSVSSIKRCNTYRWCILPQNFKESLLKIPENVEKKYVQFLERSVESRRPCIKVYKHGMQGMGAIIAGVVNTTHCKGIQNIMESHSDSFTKSYIFTTQDDVGRAVILNKDFHPAIPQHDSLKSRFKL